MKAVSPDDTKIGDSGFALWTDLVDKRGILNKLRNLKFSLEGFSKPSIGFKVKTD
jgi:hypothetical protein